MSVQIAQMAFQEMSPFVWHRKLPLYLLWEETCYEKHYVITSAALTRFQMLKGQFIEFKRVKVELSGSL